MATQSNKAPLGIFILWHSSFEEGQEHADILFSEFRRNVTDPLSRGIGIPVYFRCQEPLLEIDQEKFHNTAIILLVDSTMVNAPAYETYVNKLLKKASANTLILPVAIDSTAYNLSDKLSSLNFIRFYEKNRSVEYLLAAISHEMARHLHVKKAAKKNRNTIPPPPLKLFISHAKADGVDFARKIKAYIESEYAFKTFFDANDIAFGYDFPQEIEQHLSHAVFIAIHTDKYASREWCRREVLLAKQHNRPILILSCLKDGESRSFPYMANVRTVHYYPLDDLVWPRLISAVMQETLRVKYQELWAQYVIRKKRVKIIAGSVSAYPPELITVLTRKKELKRNFIYPDPPLGAEELAILKQFDPNIVYQTPSSLQHFTGRKLNAGSYNIGLSISECEDMIHWGMGHAHLQDTMIEVARHLLNQGFDLVYGGDPNYKADFNFTELLLQLAQTYRSASRPSGRIYMYSAFPAYTRISARKEAELKRIASIIRVTPPKWKQWEKKREETASPADQEFLKNLFACADMESKMIWAESLTLMREQMAKNVSARIVMGGKLEVFRGKLPGILEETLADLASGHKVFLVDSMGGCAKMISDLLTHKHVAALAQLESRQHEFNTYYNSKMPSKQQIRYEGVQPALQKKKGKIQVYSEFEIDTLIADVIKTVGK